MTSTASHDLARAFVAALSAGSLPDDLLTPDFTAWTTTSGAFDKARYQGGVQMLASLCPAGVAYTIDSITAEDDRVAIEARSHGVLTTGEDYRNTYVFMLRVRDGRVSSAAEHINPTPVREKLIPLMQAKMAPAAR